MTPASETMSICGSPQTGEETESSTETRLARPWSIVVHDDPVTLMDYVVRAFQEVFGYGHQKAERLMREVHETGRSLVWTGPRETAELHVSKLHQRHLLATLEQSGE